MMQHTALQPFFTMSAFELNPGQPVRLPNGEYLKVEV
jgi:hypothetical protein